MSQWTATELGRVVSLQRGYDITKRQQSAGPYPVISSSGPTSTHSEYKLEPPGVVIGRKGSLGGVYYAATPYWPHDTTLWVRDFHGNDARFIYYFLGTLGLERFDAGASNPTLNRNHLHGLAVHVPHLSVQVKIAAVLGAYDDLIENNRRRMSLLAEVAERIYREWFVECRYPSHGTVPIVMTELGPFPEGWAVRPLSELAAVVRGRSYRGVDIGDEGGVPFINLKCIARNGGFRPDGVKRYLGEYKPQHTVVADDIVMAVTDMTQERRVVARVARIPESGEAVGVISMDLVKLVPQNVPSEYLYSFLRYSRFADEVKGHANGANVLHLHPDRISEYRVAVAPRDLRDRYAALVAPIYRESDQLASLNAALIGTRAFLMPKLISGEIDVEHRDLTMPATST
jgi:type I restriction enzyme S subunit